MRILRCMIVDDEPLAVKMIENYVNRTDGLELVASYNNPVTALDELDKTPIDLLFLDIQMPKLDGLQLSRQIAETTKIIFTTAFKQYAFESYEVSAVDYMLKPIRYQKFLAAVEKARRFFDTEAQPASNPTEEDNRDSLFLRINEELKRINLDDITYITSMKDYIRIKLKDKNIPLTTHLTMQSIETQLPQDRFMRINRAFIVALNKIRTIDRNYCVYIDNEIIRVTDTYRDAFQQYLDKNMPK